MKCLVCGMVYEAAECPRCRFPYIQMVGDQESVFASLKPTIEAYRKSFFEKIKVELVAYRWKAVNDQIVLDHEEKMPLGTIAELQNGEVWLKDKFARIADVQRITVTVCITEGDSSRNIQVEIPNLHNAELQQLGARLDEECNLRLMLRNDTQPPTISVPVPLFP